MAITHYLKGLDYSIKTFSLLPWLISKQDCEQTYFVKSGLTNNEMRDFVTLFRESDEYLSHTNIFFVEMHRVYPKEEGATGDGFLGQFLAMFSVSVNINSEYHGTNEVNAGTRRIRHLKQGEDGDVEIVFRNANRNLMEDFFLKDGDGEWILPEDGTCLLPTEYFFRLSVYKFDIIKGIRLRVDYVKGYYHVGSNISIGFDAEDESIQTFSVTFEKMETSDILPDDVNLL